MKKFFTALESDDSAVMDSEIDQLLEAEGIDSEDQAEVEQAAQSEVSEIAMESAEIDRALDIVDSTTDVATIVSEGEGELTNREQDLVRATANMAVAGTDVDASDIVPGIESAFTRAQLVASIEGRAGDVLNSIMGGIGKLFARFRKVLTYLANIFRSELTLLKKVEAALKTKTDASGTVKFGKVITGDANGKMVASAKDSYKNVLESFKLYQKANSIISSYGTPATEAFGDVVSARFSDEAIVKINKDRQAMCKDVVSAFEMKKEASSEYSENYQSRFLSGDVALNVSIPKDKSGAMASQNYINITDDMSGYNVDAKSASFETNAKELLPVVTAAIAAITALLPALNKAYKAVTKLNSGNFVTAYPIADVGLRLASRGIRTSREFLDDYMYVAGNCNWGVHRAARALRKVSVGLIGIV